MKIAIIDAQGAGIGKTVISSIRRRSKDHTTLIALGTNSTAADNMKNAGAHVAVSGSDDICTWLRENPVDAIIGPIGILANGGILGEISPEISNLVFTLECRKYIIPLKTHGLYIPGTKALSIKEMVEEIVNDLLN